MYLHTYFPSYPIPPIHYIRQSALSHGIAYKKEPKKEMPSFFTFDQGRERFQNESSPLLGRFRAVPNAHTDTNGRARRKSLLGFSIDGCGGAFGGRDEGDEGGVDGYYCDGDEEDEGGVYGWRGKVRKWGGEFRDTWIEPKQRSVAGCVERWWWRWGVLVGAPSVLVSEMEGVSLVFWV